MSLDRIAISIFTLLTALSTPAALHAQEAPAVTDAPLSPEAAAVPEAPSVTDDPAAPAAPEASAAAEASATAEAAANDEAQAIAPIPEPVIEEGTEISPVEPDAFGDGDPLPDPEIDDASASGEDEESISTAVWATAGVAAGSVIVGTVFGFLALSEQASFEDDPTEQKADRGETYALLADVFLFTALASGVTALVLHYGRRGGDEDEPAVDEVAIDIAPVVGRRAGGLSARMRF